MTHATASLRDTLESHGLIVAKTSYTEVAELGRGTHGVWWSVTNRKTIARYLTDGQGTFCRGWVMTAGERGRSDVTSTAEFLRLVEVLL